MRRRRELMEACSRIFQRSTKKRKRTQVIPGSPSSPANVGKSTLVNALVGEER